MHHVFKALLVVALSSTGLGCPNRANVQCETNPNCNLTPGGVCAVVGTGNHWCAYPDASCPGGYRFDNQDIGDGLAGMCVLPADAGIDVPPPIDGVPAAPSISCKALPHTCGANGNDDCCRSPTVPGGMFFRNFDVVGDGDMNSPAMVSTFLLDKYEVTVGRYRAFLDANRGTQSNPPETGSGENPYIGGSGWQAAWNVKLPMDRAAAVAGLKSCAGSPFPTWTDSPNSAEELPISCVTWYEAMAFCAWDGAFLPTDAELNYAGAGGAEQRAYPWSSPPTSVLVDDQHANFGCKGATSCAPSDIHKVGLLPLGDGKFGQSDLAGNVKEWTLDWNEFGGGACLQGKNTTTDCADIAAMGPDSPKLMRGAMFLERDGTKLRTGLFSSEPAPAPLGYFGIRCGRAP